MYKKEVLHPESCELLIEFAIDERKKHLQRPSVKINKTALSYAAFSSLISPSDKEPLENTIHEMLGLGRIEMIQIAIAKKGHYAVKHLDACYHVIVFSLRSHTGGDLYYEVYDEQTGEKKTVRNPSIPGAAVRHTNTIRHFASEITTDEPRFTLYIASRQSPAFRQKMGNAIKRFHGELFPLWIKEWREQEHKQPNQQCILFLKNLYSGPTSAPEEFSDDDYEKRIQEFEEVINSEPFTTTEDTLNYMVYFDSPRDGQEPPFRIDQMWHLHLQLPDYELDWLTYWRLTPPQHEPQ